jgi:cytochrome oxidase Cu insertion factor (SCO1/SenC/PrrC family)
VRRRKPGRRTLLWVGVMAGLLALAACGAGDGGGTASAAGQMDRAQGRAAEANPDLDTGTSLGDRAAPGIRLVNQFGQPMSLSQFRGKVVVLVFVDSECTTVCPLTTVSMTAARELLGAAGDQGQLLGVDANPAATSVRDVMAYSQAHAMVNQWDFLTGSPAQLRAVLSAVPSGSVTLGPGQPRLVMFFATWLSETSDLRAHLIALSGYAAAARHAGLPPLVAVDEAVSEPSPGAARAYLQ